MILTHLFLMLKNKFSKVSDRRPTTLLQRDFITGIFL